MDYELEPKSVKKKRFKPLISDSESSEEEKQRSKFYSENITDKNSKVICNGLSLRLEEGPVLDSGDNFVSGAMKSLYKKKPKVLSSDSEMDSEDEKKPLEDQDKNDSERVTNLSPASLISSSCHVQERENISSYKSMFQNSDLYDAEGSSDEGTVHSTLDINDKSKSNLDNNKASKKKKIPPRKSKQSALEEIHSETQRLVRQSRVSLPYHQPKQHSLREFLSRRNIPIIPLKTSSEKLTKVWQCIEEREKTAEMFYKSESEHSEEENEDKTKFKMSIKKSEVSNNLSCSIEAMKSSVSSCISDTDQKMCGVTNDKNNFPNVNSCIPLTLEILQKDIQDTSFSLSSLSEGCKDSIEKFNVELKEEETSLECSEPASLKLSLTENALFEISTSNKPLEKIDFFNDTEDINGDLNPQNIDNLSRENCSISMSVTNKKLAIEECAPSVKENLEQCDKSIKYSISEKIKTKNKISSLLHHSLLDIKLDSNPKISGSPKSFIDLNEGSEKPAALKLVTRFIKHAKLKPQVKKEEKLSVTVAEIDSKGEVTNLTDEVLRISVKENSKPGETRLQLKERLKEKIAQRREEEFVKRVEEYKLSEEFYQNECETCSADEVEEIDEEVELNESSATDSEPEDNIFISDKVKRKNDFVCDEAEETEGETCTDDEDEEAMEKAVTDDNDTYSESSSVNVGQLLNEKNSVSSESLNASSLVMGSGLSGLCSGSFPTQGLNLKDLEKNELNNSKHESETISSFLQEDASRDTVISERTSKNIDVDSDDEIVSKRTKKKVKLTFSDDEDDKCSIRDQNQKTSIGDQENESDASNDDEASYENYFEREKVENKQEVEVETNVLDEDEYEEAFLKNPISAAKRFFEDEAELSGSECSSGDEDEADLDKYEEEQGDNDVFNQRKVQTELEKLHMKNMLDDDKREIRILQELLLEDGELHSDGPKRQRQFKWYNQDENALQHSYLENDDDEQKEGPEEEEDESWRKTRMERENYLCGLQNDDDVDFNQRNSITKVEHKIIRPPTKLLTPNAVKNTSPDPRKKFTLITKRGSFLNRGEKVLSKLAEITNVGSENSMANSKGARNMVFSTISPEKNSELIKPVSKRKCLDETLGISKRLKFTAGDLHKTRQSVFDKLKLNETL